MEAALFEQAILEKEEGADVASAQAQAFVDASKGLQRIALYAGRIQRTLDKDTARLDALQSARKAAYAKAQEEAILLAKLARSQNWSFSPASHFPSDGDFGGFLRKYRRHGHHAFPEPVLRLQDALGGRGEVGGVSRTVMPSLPSRRTWC
jgi:hypothetical protein